MVRAPELYTPLSSFDVMTRSDDEAILAQNTCDFYGGKYCIIVGSLHSIILAAPMAWIARNEWLRTNRVIERYTIVVRE
jgi:hypothetical protein